VLERTDLHGRPGLGALGPVRRGKVRDVYPLHPLGGEPSSAEPAEPVGERLVLVTTDRLSAFDRVLGCVPAKGQVLNELSSWWFGRLEPIVPNHLVAVPDPNVSVVTACQALPVEVVVRGYITGVTSTSLWRQYDEGRRDLYGLRLPDGLAKNDALPGPVVTPTTKAADGDHDEPLSAGEVVERGLVGARRWDEVLDAAVELFTRGQAIASAAGLILVDTKYEFGVDGDGRLRLIDEVHTPDSSRYWLAATYAARRAAGDEPDSADKEVVRRWYADHGYRGDGDPPALPPDLAADLSARYVDVYERLTGAAFVPAAEPAEPRVEAALRAWLDPR
jgi:phosphoribosylaminoimidazole-succinocarboxamide synthase